MEVVVVVAMVGLLVAIAAPSWLEFENNQRLKAGQDQIFQALRLGQNEAMRHHLTWEVNFRENNDLVQWATHSAVSLPTANGWHNLNPKVHIDTRESTLAVTRGLYRIQFNQHGYTNGQLGRMTLSGNPGSRLKRCVFVSTLLGNLRRGKNQSRPDAGGRYCY